jgi:hypothetical protein
MKPFNRRLILPVAIVALGCYVQVGCFPIPATRQFMINGKPKPSWEIGKDEKKPIRLGHTHIEEAMVFLKEHLSGPDTAPGIFGVRMYGDKDIRAGWSASADRRHYQIPYRRRTMYWVFPICFMAVGEEDREYLILHVDEAGVVTGYEVFDEKEARDNRYHIDVPLFPNAGGLRAITTQPTTLPATTQP